MKSIRTTKEAIKIVALTILLTATSPAMVLIQNQNQNTNPLIYQNLFPYVNSPTNQPIAVKTIIWNDKTVTGIETYNNAEIILNGNLTIASGGSLTLTSVTLRVNCSANGSNRIEVQNGGKLYINDTDGNPNTRNDASNITAYNPSYRFLFWVQSGATFQMKNSELHYCGYNISYYDRGLLINTNNTIVENNTLTNNYFGIVLYNAYHNTIRCNTATNNDYGLGLYYSSNNSFTCNVAVNNTIYGFRLWFSSNNSLTGNIAIGNYYGYSLFSSLNNNLTENTGANNNYGFELINSSKNLLHINEAINSTIKAYYLDKDSIGNNLTGSVVVNYLRVRVISSYTFPISGMNVKVTVNGSTVYATPWYGGRNFTTDKEGFTDWIPIPYQVYSGEIPFENIVEVQVLFLGSRVVNMSKSHTETFFVQQDKQTVLIGENYYLVIGMLITIVLAGLSLVVKCTWVDKKHSTDR